MTRVTQASLALLALAALLFLPIPSPALEDATPSLSNKIAIPDTAAQRVARKQINDTFAKDIAKAKKPAEKSAIAKQLLQAGKESSNDPAGKYEMLSMARDLAVAGGDADTALAAITELDSYAIDALKLKTDALAAILKSAVNSQDALGIAANVGPLVDEALAADRYNVARQLAELAVSAARSAKDADAIAQANARLDEVREIDAASGQAAKAAAILSTKPNDPAASLALGRFEAFIKRNWEKGLPLLTAGSDSTLKGLAEIELLAPNDTDKLVSLADGWWAVAEKERGVAQAHLREHAAKWYKVVLPNLSALAKIKAEKRVKEAASVQTAHTGWVDLLRRVNIERDTVAGTWAMEKAALSVTGAEAHSRIRIAAKPDGAYEVGVQYQRSSGSADQFGVFLPVGNNKVTLIVGSQQMGFNMVDGKSWIENESTKSGDFGRDQKKHVLDIIVAPGEAAARILVRFDGKQMIDWSGSSSKLSVWSPLDFPDPASLGLSAEKASFKISEISLRAYTDVLPPLSSKK